MPREQVAVPHNGIDPGRCFVQASPVEGFSMGMLEAMLCGVPCALTHVGVLLELERRHGRHWESIYGELLVSASVAAGLVAIRIAAPGRH